MTSATADSLSSSLGNVVESLSKSQPQGDIRQILAHIAAHSPTIDALASPNASSSPEHPNANRDFIGPKDVHSYTREEDVNWSTNCQLPAACFVKPTNTVQVALSLKIVSLVGAKFAVRNGGHNPNVGFASIDGSGLLIDLSGLTSLKLSTDRKILEAGTGNHWDNVQRFLDRLQMSAVGGRYLGVGISGQILGGGLPIIPSLYGLACDNVQNFEVVLGNASVVNANFLENPCLFKALKGGGNNFGIVTRFDLYTTPLHKIWYKSVTFNSTAYPEVLNATTEVQAQMETDSNAGIIVLAGFGVIKITYIYACWTTMPAVFDALNSMNPIGVDIEETNGTVLSFSELGSAPEPPANRLPIGLTSSVDIDLYHGIYRRFLSLQHYSNGRGTGLSINIQQFGKAAVNAGNARGGNILGNQAIAQNWWSALVQWTDPGDAEVSKNVLMQMRDSIEAAARARDHYLPYVFANDGAYFQKVMASYGPENLALMRDVSRKYDPGQVFQTLQNGGWLLRNS